MTPVVQNITTVLALGIVLLLALLLVALGYRLLRGRWLPELLTPYAARYGLYITALLPVMAFGMSLWYSEVVGIPVCPLCWFARSMMYPLAVILTVAAFRRDIAIAPYATALALVGLLITGYHHLYQVGLAPSGACDLLAEGGTCAVRYVFEFGFVTMPLMGFALFAAIVVLLRAVREAKRA